MQTNLTPGTTSDFALRQARLIVDSAIDYAIVGLDLDGVITSWNVGAERIMGWRAAEAIGQPVDLFFTPEDVATRIPAAEMGAALRHGRGIDERWHLRADGARFWANGEMMPLRTADGSLEGYVKILRDRTDQHAAAAALSDSEERYRTLYDAIDEGFCLIEVRCDDAARPIDYRFIEVNAAFERQTGLVDAAGSWMRDIAPDHEQYWYDIYSKVALTGDPVRFALPAQALNGRWYEVFAYRVGVAKERLVAILFSDITERRTQEARLKANEEHLRSLNATLRDSERNLRLLLDSISEGFYAVDRDGLTTTCNAAFLRMMGFADVKDVVGRRLHELIHHSHPDGRAYPVADCPIYRAARAGTPAYVEEELFYPVVGDPLWVAYRATPIVQDGELQGAICTFRDIGERRSSERQRRQAEERRAGLLHVGEALRDMDDVEAMAEAAAATVGETLGVDAAGFGRIDASGETLVIDRDWKTTGRGLAGAHAMRDYGSFVDDLLADRTVVIDDIRADLRTRDHAADFDAIGVAALVNAPIVERGRLSAIFCAVAASPRAWTREDVDFIKQVGERTRTAIERRRAEAELRLLADTLQQQVEVRTQERDRVWTVSRDLLGVAGVDGVWQSVNPAWTNTLGWAADAIVGRTSSWIEHPDDRARTRAELGRLAAGDHVSIAFENRFRTKDGSYCDLSWSAVPVDGLLYCVARDVTEQKRHEAALLRAEDQLRQSQKVEAVGQLTGGVAHDFNNLLTVIRGSVDLLRRPDLSDEKRARYIAAISDTADRATKLTSQLLAFARRQALKAETFDVSGSIAGIRDMLDTLTGSRVAITVDIPPGEHRIRADRSQFDTALVNMAVNARDAMAGEGRLSIAVRDVDAIPAVRSHPMVPGRFVAIAIRDTGTGIAPDQIDRIFEPFYTTKGVGHGTGLGLSQVFGFAKQSSGDVIVDSDPGEGATFTLYLPTAPDQDPQVPTLVGAMAASLPRGACILVVEDNQEVGSFATQALSELGYRTTLAVDAVSALVELGSDGAGFDLVFSDVVMPGMSGIELGQEIRRRYPLVPVVLTSGYSSVLAEQDRHEFELLQKPYSLEELSTALAQASVGLVASR